MTTDSDVTDPYVIVVDPERELVETLCFHFEIAGCRCAGMTSPDEALRRMTELPVDLLVVDFTASGRSAADLSRRLKQVAPHRTRVLLLATRRDDPHVLAALERYADDFVTKPINVPEVLARGRALMRRTRRPGDAPPVALIRGDLSLDMARRHVAIAGVELRLTNQEFRLLHALAAHPGVVFTRQELLKVVWNGNTHVTARSVDALVKRVRRCIEAAAPGHSPLRTVRGVGYKFLERAPGMAAPGGPSLRAAVRVSDGYSIRS